MTLEELKEEFRTRVMKSASDRPIEGSDAARADALNAIAYALLRIADAANMIAEEINPVAMAKSPRESWDWKVSRPRTKGGKS
jgi:hypothetical protein